MGFEPVPDVSRTEIDRAGSILKEKKKFSKQDYSNAWDLVNKWRASHAYPINTFQSTLRTKVASFKDGLVAQRLKRMPTIQEKLGLLPTMRLSSMQDIGGVRAILNSIEEVDELVASYEGYADDNNFRHELAPKKDYIRNPSKSTGYRSVHLVYKYNSSYRSARGYNGLRIEIQIRTRLQHLWATAVESMGTFRREALKSRQGDQQWIDFFRAVSNVFAIQ
jgi:ppGpp synthetase/RelA/SpoT-type nucleotidyltranferase